MLNTMATIEDMHGIDGKPFKYTEDRLRSDSVPSPQSPPNNVVNLQIKRIEKEINGAFEKFIHNWNHKTYVLVGAYGSSKSYHVGLKLILKAYTEKRKILVVREVYETIRESCFSLFEEILDELGLLAAEGVRSSQTQVISRVSPMSLTFPNGSKIIFKGLDKPKKLKSINGVSIIWAEETTEMKYSGYKELLGRMRHPDDSLHIILSFNPTDEENWVYKHFFIDEENDRRTLDPRTLYKKRTVVRKNVYYHHSLPEDNKFLKKDYIDTLDELKEYDPDLYRVARLGRFGVNGLKVLPQAVQADHESVMTEVKRIPEEFKFRGLDFGFEESSNAFVRMAVDDDTKTLYIYQELYKNKLTDPQFAVFLREVIGEDEIIVADSAEPKAIRYYNMSGFWMRGAKKQQRKEQVRKMKRFKRIVISSQCPNVWRELRNLTYKKDSQERIIYDEFNIDPHTFSAIWYGLDLYVVPDLKEVGRNSLKGAA